MTKQEDKKWESRSEKYVAYGFMTIVIVLFALHIIDKIVKFSKVSETFPTWQLM